MPSPWSIKGIPQEARAAAKAAAQRQGMTLGAWIVSKIEEEAGAETAGVSEASLQSGPVRQPVTVRRSDPNAAALQSIAQMFGQHRAEMESQAVATLTARLDALAAITESLSSTVAHCLKSVEESAHAVERVDAASASASENAEIARNEAAVAMRASAAVAEKVVEALGGVESPGEDIRRELEEMLDERVGQIESRIAANEAEDTRRLEDLAESVGRTEAMLETISARLGATIAPSALGAADPYASAPAAFDTAADAFEDFDPIDATDGDVLEIGDLPDRVSVAPIEAPQLRERIRNRLKASDGAAQDTEADGGEEAAASELAHDRSYASADLSPDDNADQKSGEDQQHDDRSSGGFGLGGWFRRRDQEEHSSEFEVLEEPGEERDEDAMQSVMEDAAPERIEPEDLASEEEVEEFYAMSPRQGATDLAFEEDVFDLVEAYEGDFEEAPENVGPASAAADVEQATEDEGFDEAIERARRERERLQAQVEADAESFSTAPAPRAEDGAPTSQRPQLQDEPLTLGPEHELPSEPASAGFSALDEEREPPFWGHLDDDGGVPPAPETEHSSTDKDAGRRVEAQAESAGSRSDARSVISADAWPFEADARLEEAGESALRDESGSVRYGVAISLALMGLTAGAAMAALYHLGA